MPRAKPPTPVLQPGLSLTSGLVFGMPLSEGKGLTARDLSGNGSNGTFTGFSAWQSGPFGPCLDNNGFSGAAYLDCGNNPNTRFATSVLSLGCWCNIGIGNSSQFAVIGHSANGSGGYTLYCAYTSGYYLEFAKTGVANTGQSNSTTPLSTGVWHHVVASLDGATCKFYIDGVLKASPSWTQSYGTYTRNLRIGSDEDDGGFYFDGQIDAPFIYNRPLSAAEVAQIYADSFQIYRRPRRFLVAVAPSISFTVAPSVIPKNHSGNITLTLAGTGTSWNNGTSIFTPSGVTGVTKISQNVTSTTAATVVVTTDATHTGTLTITESVTGTATATTTVATATLDISPTSGGISTTPTLTLTGGNTVWSQETAAGLFSVSGGTGSSIGTPTITTNTAGTVVLTTGSASGTLTITDNSTGATTTFTVTRVAAATFYVRADGNDSNTGLVDSSGGAWLTLSKASSANGPSGGYIAGDTLTIDGAAGAFTGNLVWTTSGTQTARCTVTGINTATINAGTGIGVTLRDCEFVTLSNLLIVGPGVATNGATTSGVTVVPSSDPFSVTNLGHGVFIYDDRTGGSKYRSVYVDNVTTHDTQYGISLLTPLGSQAVVGYVDVRITNCTCYNHQQMGIWVAGGSTWAAVNFHFTNGLTTFLGVYIGGCNIYNVFGDPTGMPGGGFQIGNTTGPVVERNIVRDVGSAGGSNSGGGCGAIVFTACDRVLCQWNEVYNVNVLGVNTTTDGVGIDLDIAMASDTSVVQYNYIHECGGAGIVNFGSDRSVYRFNVCRNNSRNNNDGDLKFTSTTVAYNNTVYLNATGASGTPAAALNINFGANHQIYNNILVTTGGIPLIPAGFVTSTIIGNLYWSSGGALHIGGQTTLAAWQATGHELLNGIVYGVNADPLLSSPTSGAGVGILPGAQLSTLTYFNLASGSPARAAAVPLSLLNVLLASIDLHGAQV